MILYHFTPMERVEAIQREGVRARRKGHSIDQPSWAPSTAPSST